MKMPKSICAIAAVLLLPIPGCGNGGPEGGAIGALAPKLLVAERNVDLGKVKPGDLLRAEFSINNIGGADLDIQKIKPSCGCTSVELSLYRLRPGESATLTAEARAPHHPEAVGHKIWIDTNDPADPQITLSFQARAIWAVDAEPREMFFGAVHKRDAIAQDLRLYSPEGKPFRVLSATSSNPSLISFSETSTSNGIEYRVTLVGGEKSRDGTFSETLTFKTSEPARETIIVPVVGELYTESGFSPKRIILNAGGPATTAKSSILVRGETLSGPAGISLRIEGKGWKIDDWKALEIAKDRSRIDVTFVRPPTIGYQRAELTIANNQGGWSAKVPVSCFVTEN